MAPPQIAQSVKNPPAMQETPIGFLGREDPLEKETAPHSTIWPGEFQGLYSPRGRKESDITERLSLSLHSLVEVLGVRRVKS